MATKKETPEETHARLLLTINNSLELDEKKDIKYLCRAYLPAAELERVKNEDFCGLVRKLETKGYQVCCRCGGYSKLVYLLKAADLPNIVKLIEDTVLPEFLGKGDSKGNDKEETHLKLILKIKNSLGTDEFQDIKTLCKESRYLQVAELEKIGDHEFCKLVEKLESKGKQVTWKQGGYSMLLHLFETAGLSTIKDMITACESELNPGSGADTKSKDKKDISGTDGKLTESDGKHENKEDSSVNAFKPKALCFGGDGKNEGNVDIQNIAENSSTYKITVALIDTGFRTDHASFSGSAATHTVELSYSFDEDLYNIDNVFDGHGHGTAVLDVLLKTCGNVKLNLILLKSDSRKTGSESLTEALNFLLGWKRDTGKPIHVVSTSLGSHTHSDELNTATAELCLSSVVITAASNEGLKDSNTISYPSLYGHTICMGAHGTVGYREADYSPQGKELTFLGPGNHANVASAINNKELRSVSGTSFAAPHMAACVAYTLAIIGSWRNSEDVMKKMTNTHLMKQLLIGFSSEQSNPTKTSGYGRLKFEKIKTDSLKHALEENRINFGLSS